MYGVIPPAIFCLDCTLNGEVREVAGLLRRSIMAEVTLLCLCD